MRTIQKYLKSETEALLLARDMYDFNILVRMYECHDASAPAPYLVTEVVPIDLPNDWQLTFDPDTQDLIETDGYIGRERRKFVRVPMRMPVSVSTIARH